MLDKFIPNIERMQTQLKKYKTTFAVTTAENEALKKEKAELEAKLDASERVSVNKRLQEIQLQQDYHDAVALLSQIPKEVLEEYTKTHKRSREVPGIEQQ